jgi:murein DD-endopeptidase MepM/ murein hydrolase activator NlpD
LLPIGGSTWIAQRFAIDWVQVGSDSATYTGDRKDNKSYHAYGSEVLAVADAVVVTTKDGIPQNVPGENSRAVPMTIETIGGNHIILDLGQGRYAFYAHLQPGSLRVKVGDHVTRGQVLALLGNSGNSTEPHLHFHVSDRNSPLASQGVPYVLESFALRGKDKRYEKREKQLPLAGDMVRFD